MHLCVYSCTKCFQMREDVWKADLERPRLPLGIEDIYGKVLGRKSRRHRFGILDVQARLSAHTTRIVDHQLIIAP